MSINIVICYCYLLLLFCFKICTCIVCNIYNVLLFKYVVCKGNMLQVPGLYEAFIVIYNAFVEFHNAFVSKRPTKKWRDLCIEDCCWLLANISIDSELSMIIRNTFSLGTTAVDRVETHQTATHFCQTENCGIILTLMHTRRAHKMGRYEVLGTTGQNLMITEA